MVIGKDSADQSLSTRHMWFAFKVRFWVRADGGDHAVRCARSWQPGWCAAGVAVFDLLLLRSIHIKLWLCARPANVRQRRMTPADSRSYLEEFFRQFFLIQRTLKMQAKCPKEIWTPNFGHTAGIISLLTHVCISVAMNIVVHPKLTYEHESACHQGLHTQVCNPSCSDSCKP